MSRTRNILFVENTAELVGGGQQSLFGLLRLLDARRYSPAVVFPCPGPLADKVHAMGIPVFYLQMGTFRTLQLGNIFGCVRRLARIIRTEKISIVHANASRTALYAGLACRITGIPLIWHVRIAMREPFYDRILYMLSTKIIAISKAVERRFPYNNKKSKIFMIYNGVDIDAFFPVDASSYRRQFGLDDKILIGQVGQIHPLKGPTYLIQTIEKLRNDYPDIHGLIVGSPTSHQRELEALIKELRLDSHITFAGWHDDVREVMSALDILVVPSQTEGFGRVLIEGMACERPVVAFSVDAIPEVIESGQSGLLVEKENLKELVAAVGSLVADPALRKRISKQGRKRVCELFDIRENVRKTQEVYDLCTL